MSFESWLALTAGLLVLALVPGPGFAAVVATAMTRGLRHAAPMAAGNALGDVVFLLFAVFGLVLLAEVLGTFFVVVKVAGTAYLVWLGIRLWRTPPMAAATLPTELTGRPWRSFLLGIAISLGNPKVIAFYLGFLPTFLDLGRLTAGDIGVAALTVFVIIAGTLMVYAHLVSASRRLLTRPRWGQLLNRAAGTMMMGTGLVLASR